MPSLSRRDEKSLRLIVAKLDVSGGPFACHPYMGCRRNGYGLIGRWVDGVPTVLSAHREIYRLVVLGGAPIPDGMDVLHWCDNPPCCNVMWCLHLGTAVENADERVARGRDRSRQGEHHHNAKLSDADARAIYLLRGKEYQRGIAARYGVDQKVVCLIQTGRGYARATSDLRVTGARENA